MIMNKRFFAQGSIFAALLVLQGMAAYAQSILPIPASTAPNMVLDGHITSNLFAAPGSSQTIVYHIAEQAGNLSVGDTLRIAKIYGFTFSLNIADYSTMVGGNFYVLDNYRWKLINTHPTYIYLVLTGPNNAPGTILPNQLLHVSLVITRFTTNVSSFALAAQLRRADGELDLSDNKHSVVVHAE
jgi:hypothetical protein